MPKHTHTYDYDTYSWFDPRWVDPLTQHEITPSKTPGTPYWDYEAKSWANLDCYTLDFGSHDYHWNAILGEELVGIHENAPPKPVWNETLNKWVEFDSEEPIPAEYTPVKIGDDWVVRLLDITVDSAYVPPAESGNGIFWERECDCWREVETEFDAEAVYSVEKECWVNAKDETAECIPLDRSAP